MQESYKGGDAHHFGCESCQGETRGRWEALTGESKIKGGDKTRAVFCWSLNFDRGIWEFANECRKPAKT